MSADNLLKRPNRAHGALDQLTPDIQLQVKDWYLAGCSFDRITAQLNELMRDNQLPGAISRGQVWRWIQRQRRDLERIERANEKAEILTRHLVGDSKDLGEAAEGLCKAILLEALVDAKPVQAGEVEDVAKIAHSLGRLASSKVARDKWEIERRKKVEESFTQLKTEIQEALEGRPELTRDLLNVAESVKQNLLEQNA